MLIFTRFPIWRKSWRLSSFRRKEPPQFIAKYCNGEEPLQLGVGGGPFDEHPRDGKPRKKGECCATLVAKALGVGESLLWKRMISYVRFTDVGSPVDPKRARPEEAAHPFDLNNLMKKRWRKLRDDETEITPEMAADLIARVFDDLEVELHSQQKLLEAKEDIKQRGQQLTIAGGERGYKVVILASPPDNKKNSQVNAAARLFFQADIVIHRQPCGHVNIFTNKKSSTAGQLDDLTQMILLEEQYRLVDIGAMKREDVVTDWHKLREEGQSPCGRWYYFRPHQQLHNGTESYEELEPTILSDDEIVRLAKIAFDRAYFEEKYALYCGQGECRSQGSFDCPLHRYGLQRCRELRFKQYQNIR